MGIEFELKYAATPEILAQLQTDFGQPVSTISMETTYYDTPSGTLSALRYTLRQRMENGTCVTTVKVPLGESARGEWECTANSLEAAVLQLCAMGAPQVLLDARQEGFLPVCGARFTRHCYRLSFKDGWAELALDEGSLSGGGREIPLWEIEVEHKAGAQGETLGLALALKEKYGLCPEPLSKFQRARGLAEGV